MIPRIIEQGVDISTVNYDDLSNYATLSDIMDGSFSKEELHTGVLTLTFDYPCDGLNADMLIGDNYVLYKINSYEVPHLFIITQIEKNADDLTYGVYCDSVRYLADIDETTYFELNAGATASNFISKLNTIGDYKKITLTTNVIGSLPNGFLSKTLRNKVDLLNSESKDSFIRGFGGYLKRFKNNIQIVSRRGSDRSEVLTYGDDLLEVSCDYDFSKLVTAVKYVCDESSDGYVKSSPIVYSTNNPTHNLNHLKTVSIGKYELQREFGYDLDLSTMLTNKVNAFFNSPENIGISEPDVSLTVRIDEKKSVYGQLFTNYKDFEFKLGDRVQLKVDRLKIDIISEISSIDYDGVREEIVKMTFGKVKRYVNSPYRADFEAPDSNNNNGSDPNPPVLPPEFILPVIPEVPPNTTTDDSGLTKLLISSSSTPLIVLNNTNITTPKMDVTIVNPQKEQVYIDEGAWAVLGDLYGPKSSNTYDNGEIVDNSRLKYFSYSDGVITLLYGKFRQDCLSAGIDMANPEYIFQPGQGFDLTLKTYTSDNSGDARGNVQILIEGIVSEELSGTPTMPSTPNPIEYMAFLYDKDSKFFTWFYPKMFAYNAFLNTKYTLKAMFTSEKTDNVNNLSNDDLFDKIIEYVIEYKEKYDPDVVLAELTEAEYSYYRDQFMVNKEVLIAG